MAFAPHLVTSTRDVHNTADKVDMRLHLTLGISCHTVSSLAADPTSSLVAYPSSGMVVIFDALKGGQLKYTQKARKVSCLNFSPDGKLLLVGESCHMPALLLWDVNKEEIVTRLYGMTYGHIACGFTNDMETVISIGTKFDGVILVWAWPSQVLIATNRFKEPIIQMAFSKIQNFFVTCGQHHLKYWYPPQLNLAKGKQPPFVEIEVLYGRPAVLEKLKTLNFVDVSCGNGVTSCFVFTVTKCGKICKLCHKRRVLMFKCLSNIELSALKVYDDELIVGTTCGHAYFINADTMEIQKVISHPLDMNLAEHVLARHDLDATNLIHGYRGTTLLAIDNRHQRLTVMVTSGSLCIWDISDTSAVKKLNYLVFHCKAISSMQLLHEHGVLGRRETLLTASHDSTVRLWNMRVSRGVCCDSSKAIYLKVEKEFTELPAPVPEIQETEKIESTSKDQLWSPTSSSTHSSKKSDTWNIYNENQERRLSVIRATKDHDVVVLGDNQGCIFAYDLLKLQLTKTLKKHTREVTTLTFFTDPDQSRILLSGGRDMKLCMFNVDKDFAYVMSISLHSSTVTYVEALSSVYGNLVVSAGREGSVILSKAEGDRLVVMSNVHLASHVVTATADRINNRVCLGSKNGEVRVMDLDTVFSVLNKFHASCTVSGISLFCLHLNTDKNILFTACSDRTINVLSYPGGQILTTTSAHISPVTGLCLSKNNRYIISTSYDGCIFFWKLRTGKVLKRRVSRRRWMKSSRSRAEMMALKKPGEGTRDTKPKAYTRANTWDYSYFHPEYYSGSDGMNFSDNKQGVCSTSKGRKGKIRSKPSASELQTVSASSRYTRTKALLDSRAESQMSPRGKQKGYYSVPNEDDKDYREEGYSESNVTLTEQSSELR